MARRRSGSPFFSALALLAGSGVLGALAYFVIIPDVVREGRALIYRGPGSLNAMANMLEALPFGSDSSRLISILL